MLKPPRVEYGQNHGPAIKGASWDLRGVKRFLKNGHLSVAPMIVLHKSDNRLAKVQTAEDWRDSQDGLVDQMRKHGFTVQSGSNNFPTETVDITNRAVAEKTLRALFTRAGKGAVGLFIVVLNTDSKADYGLVKRLGDLEYGIATSCVQSKNIQKVKPQYTDNVILKINIRLGGKFCLHLEVLWTKICNSAGD